MREDLLTELTVYCSVCTLNVSGNASVFQVCDSEEDLRELYAHEMRCRDLGYLAPRIPPLKRLRYRVSAPHLRFCPVIYRQHHCVRGPRRYSFVQRSFRKFASRNGGLLAIRASKR